MTGTSAPGALRRGTLTRAEAHWREVDRAEKEERRRDKEGRRQPPAGLMAPPKPWAPLEPAPIERWTGDLKDAFEWFAPHAVYVASPERPISMALLEPRWKPAEIRGGSGRGGAWSVRVAGWRGGNPFAWQQPGTDEDRVDHIGPKGCLPVQIDLTGWQMDKVTARLPKDPYFPWAVRRRWWTWSIDRAGELESLVKVMLCEARQRIHMGAESLRHGFIDAGWRFDAQWFEQECLIPAAKRSGIWVRSEAGLEQFLRRALELSWQRYGRHSEAGPRKFRRLCLRMIRAERAALRKDHALARRTMTVLGEALPPAFVRTPESSPAARGFQLRKPNHSPEIERQIEEVIRSKRAAREVRAAE